MLGASFVLLSEISFVFECCKIILRNTSLKRILLEGTQISDDFRNIILLNDIIFLSQSIPD